METVDYVVKQGDTLYGISKIYNTTVAKLIELNDLDGTLIIEGQIIKVPATKGPIVTTYIIEQGDTIASIFDKLDIDYEFLNEYPGLLTLELVPGQEIVVGFTRKNVSAKKKLERILIDNNITSDELILLNSNWLNQEIKYK